MSSVSNNSISGLENLWMNAEHFSENLKSEEERTTSYSSSAKLYIACTEVSNWFIENRGGFAYVSGLIMVPSQFLGLKAGESLEIIKNVKEEIEIFNLPVNNGDTYVDGIIFYPNGWDKNDSSRCVLYHNPNGITVAGYFKKGSIFWTPAEILKLYNCPIIMYDYRGTGLSSDNECSSSLAFRPTYESVVVDGETVLKHTLDKFDFVTVIGSSLGGGVATVSLERHLEKFPSNSSKVVLINHDSFSTTPRVAMPTHPIIADWTGWALGGLLDAETSMKKLIARNILIMIIWHRRDPVIPPGARMAEYVESLPQKRNVTIICSPQYGHANLSEDMVSAIQSSFKIKSTPI